MKMRKLALTLHLETYKSDLLSRLYSKIRKKRTTAAIGQNSLPPSAWRKRKQPREDLGKSKPQVPRNLGQAIAEGQPGINQENTLGTEIELPAPV